MAAYASGITMFAFATWALLAGVVFGWTGAAYRIFFLFGAVLNIPVLALGSMFLVVGRRSGHAMTILLGGFAAISTTLALTVDFINPLPEEGVPTDIFATGFGPRMFAIIGGTVGSTILVTLALTSVVRFWNKNRAIVWGSLLIAAGVFAAAWGGTGVALGEAGGFALSLLLAVSLIWAGYRVASGGRRPRPADNGEQARRENGADRLEDERA